MRRGLKPEQRASHGDPAGQSLHAHSGFGVRTVILMFLRTDFIARLLWPEICRPKNCHWAVLAERKQL